MAHAIASASSVAARSCSGAGNRRTGSYCRTSRLVAASTKDNGRATVAANDEEDVVADDADVNLTSRRVSRRGALRAALGATAAFGMSIDGTTGNISLAASDAAAPVNPRAYFQRYPTLFAPFYGDDERATVLKEVVPGSVWALEQNLAIGPLETPLRCVVVKLNNDTLWVHAPLAPTEEFFDLIESLGAPVGHIVVPTYALEHKVFARDAAERYPDADIWVAPGQFAFPVEVPLEKVFGREIAGVLGTTRDEGGSGRSPPWLDEIDCEVLKAGKFTVAFKDVTIREAAFFHKASKTLVVTDAVARIPYEIPPLQSPEKLLLVSKRSTADPMPADTPEARLAGWKKMCLLVNYFFPEHEEMVAGEFGVVEWTPGWEDNFDQLAGRLLVPPVVRSLLYSQDPSSVREWVDMITAKWDFQRVIPAHWEGPIDADVEQLRAAFRFLENPEFDRFPEPDMRRGLQPIADLVITNK